MTKSRIYIGMMLVCIHSLCLLFVRQIRNHNGRKKMFQVKLEWTMKMLFENGYFFPKLFWPIARTNCSSDRENFLKFEAEGREFAKFLRLLRRTIYLNSERSEQFLVTEFFLTCSCNGLLVYNALSLEINFKDKLYLKKVKKDFSFWHFLFWNLVFS